MMNFSGDFIKVLPQLSPLSRFSQKIEVLLQIFCDNRLYD